MTVGLDETLGELDGIDVGSLEIVGWSLGESDGMTLMEG